MNSSSNPVRITAPIEADDLAALRSILEGTAHATGKEFFSSLVRCLAEAIDTKYAFVAEFSQRPVRVHTLAYWGNGQIQPRVEFDLRGTPCEDVVRGRLCHHPQGVKTKFPEDRGLVDLDIESYLGVPLLDADGRVLGHLAVFDDRPMPEEPRKQFIFQIFAARAAAELARLRMEAEWLASEQRYRDLYEEAPIAYVKEDLESRFISANRAATRILGITPEEVPGTVGMSFVPNTPDAQRRVRDAFASIGSGADTSGVVLELRRRDNGQPIWIQWWSKPEPDGQYTRTMFVDITAQILAEAEKSRLEQQNSYLREEIKAAHNFEEIVGQSPALLAVLEQVERVAATDSSVLIHGETGTGKELIARAIHSRSRRRDKPLIKINCAALPTGLVESELFGHEKGAFTGALAKRLGRFELAEGGTIFLDEVGEIPADAQAKLLRVLQEREFERVGGQASIRVDVRVIAATNRDLRASVREKTFREDLFYRLNVFPVALPPLRERRGDIPLLAHFLLDKFAARVGKRIEAIDSASMNLLQAYAWPGNIRELENVLERAVILAAGQTLHLEAEWFPADSVNAFQAAAESRADASAPESSSLEAIERCHILSVLERTRWVIDGPRGAAKLLGLHPNTLRSRLKKLGIERATPTE